MQEVARRFKLDFRLASARDHAQSYAQLEAGKADAFATDDVLLYGLVAQHKAQNQYQVVGEFLSYDPTASCSARATRSSRTLVSRASTTLPRTARSSASTSAGSCSALPSGQSLDLPMSPQLETLIRAMAAKPE